MIAVMLSCASGYVEEALLSNYVLERGEDPARKSAGFGDSNDGPTISLRISSSGEAPPSPSSSAGQVPQVRWGVWSRNSTARKDDIEEPLSPPTRKSEAYLLQAEGNEIVLLRCLSRTMEPARVQLLRPVLGNLPQLRRSTWRKSSMELLGNAWIRLAGGHRG